MIELNEKIYKLCGLDTNIISNIVTNRHTIGKGFIELFPPSEVVPCFSPYTLFELRRHRGIFAKFLDFFFLYPCAILQNEEQLFNNELEYYPNSSNINPILFGFSVFNEPTNLDLKSLMDKLFSLPAVLQREAEWPKMKEEILTSMLSLRSNFPPQSNRYTSKDAIGFVKEAALQQVIMRAPTWVQEQLTKKQVPEIDAFPSVKMSLYSVFYRLYEPYNRKPESQDVFDIFISTTVPYLDAIVVENFQAEITRKISKRDPFVNHVDVYTLKDLRLAV